MSNLAGDPRNPQAAAAAPVVLGGHPTLPASSAYPLGFRLSGSGAVYTDSLTLLDSTTGDAYRLLVVGGVLTLIHVPTVADIRADFATVVALRSAVATVAAVRRWGFA